MSVFLCVITEAPEGPGNRHNDVVWLFRDKYVGKGHTEMVPTEEVVVLRQTFTAGEIFLVNDSGQEIGYPQRDPSKWDVRWRLFPIDQAEAAVGWCRQVQDRAGA